MQQKGNEWIGRARAFSLGLAAAWLRWSAMQQQQRQQQQQQPRRRPLSSEIIISRSLQLERGVCGLPSLWPLDLLSEALILVAKREFGVFSFNFHLSCNNQRSLSGQLSHSTTAQGRAHTHSRAPLGVRPVNIPTRRNTTTQFDSIRSNPTGTNFYHYIAYSHKQLALVEFCCRSYCDWQLCTNLLIY